MSSAISLPAAATPDPSAFAALLVQSDLIALALARGDTLLFANAAFCRLFGRREEVSGQQVASLFVLAHRARVTAALRSARPRQTSCVAEVVRTEGTVVAVELRILEFAASGETLCAIFAQDVTERSGVVARLNLLAFSDPLTGLANRALFADRLRQAALEARRDGRSFALVMLDLDHFKPVNDQHGHAVGDLVLQQVAARLQTSLRATETIARLGGDEFAVLLPGIVRDADITTVANRVLTAIRQPMEIGDLRLAVDASAGIARFPDHGESVEHLAVAADLALYTAKQAGRGCCAWATRATSDDTVPPAIIWSVAHEVGVPLMDAQHARMAALLNALAAVLHNGEDAKAAFEAFTSFAALHFADEERLMAQAHYPAAGAHGALHQRLIGDIHGLKLEGEGFSPSLVLRYLQEWFFRHVDGADRELAASLHTIPSSHG